MFKKFKTVMFLLLLCFFALPFVGCDSSYNIKITLSTSISAIDQNNRVELVRQLENVDPTVNQFTITASVSAKKGVDTTLEVAVDKPDIVKILNIEKNNNQTILTCQGVGAGEALVKFVSFGGVSESLRIYVNEPLRNIDIAPNYTPFAFVGKTTKFDTQKILYNSFGVGAVEPNLENKQVRFYTNRRGVTVNKLSGDITVANTFTGESFELEIRPVNTEVDSRFVTVEVLKAPTLSTRNLIVSSNNNSLVEPKYQSVVASDGVIDVDLALFPTDVNYKSATLSVENFLLSGKLDTLKTKFAFEEVDNFNSNKLYTSGNVNLKLDEFKNNQATLLANDTTGAVAYFNVYAYVEANREATNVLIARVKVRVEYMPNNIVVRNVAGEIIDSTINVYNHLQLKDYEQVNVKVFEGRYESVNANAYFILNNELERVVGFKGAEAVVGQVGHYKIVDPSNFGFYLKEGVRLSDITDQAIKNKTITFYAGKEFGFSEATKEELVFENTTKTFNLNLMLLVDEIRFYLDNPQNAQKILDLNLIANSNAQGFEPVIEINYNAYLNGIKTNEFSSDAFNFVSNFDNLNYVVNSSSILIYPNQNIIGEFKIYVESFGIDSNQNYLNINSYLKPSDIYLTVGNVSLGGLNSINQANFNLATNTLAVGYFEAKQIDETNEIKPLELADIKITEINVLKNNEQVNLQNFITFNGRVIMFNSKGVDSGEYNVTVTLIDGGNNVYKKTFNVFVYVEVFPSSFYIKTNDLVLTNYKDTLYTKNSVSLDREQSLCERSYELYIPSLGDDLKALQANGIVVKAKVNNQGFGYFNDYNAFRNESNTIITIESKNNNAKVVIDFEISQHNNVISTITLVVDIVNAKMVNSLSLYNDLPFVSNEHGYLLSKTNLDGTIGDFKFEFSNNIFDNALDSRLGFVLDSNAMEFVNFDEYNLNLSFKKDSTNKNIAGEGYLYIYTLDSLDGEFDINNPTGNYIKINLVVANGEDVGIVVFTEEDFLSLSGKTLNYQLKSNIKLSDGFTPIKEFLGSFNGNNFAIYNVNYSGVYEESVGLFKGVYNTISNLNIVYVDSVVELNDRTAAFGLLAGESYGATIKNINVSAQNNGAKIDVNSYIDGSGLVGNVDNGVSIDNCYVKAIINDENISYKNQVEAQSLEVSQKVSVIDEAIVVNFSLNAPVDLNKLFVYKNASGEVIENNINVEYIFSNNNIYVVNNYAIVTRAGEVNLNVKINGGENNYKILFKYAGNLPASRSNFLYSVRKNNVVDLEKLKVQNPIKTSIDVVSAKINNEVVEGDDLKEIYSIDASGRFSANRAGTYTLLERVYQDNFGDLLTNTVIVEVFEGATNLSVDILNGTVVEQASAQIAPFERLNINVRITTDVDSEPNPLVSYDSIIVDGVEVGDYLNLMWLHAGIQINANKKVVTYNYVITVKEEYQQMLLGKQVDITFVSQNREAYSTIRVNFIQTLPNYIETYYLNDKVDRINGLNIDANSNELIPEFKQGESSIGGYQTFVFDVFPDYVASENLTIEASQVKNLNQPNNFVPLPKVVNTKGGLEEFSFNSNAPKARLQQIEFNKTKKLYYLLPIYMPLEGNNSGSVNYRANMGDVYEFTFTIYLNKGSASEQSYVITKNLTVTYPILLTGEFVSDTAVNMTSSASSADAVAFGTTFDVKLNIFDPSSASGGDVKIEYELSNASKINFVKNATLDNNVYRFKLENFYNGSDTDYSNVKITFKVTKTLNGVISKSNNYDFVINPVIYKIKNLQFATTVDGIETYLDENTKLNISASHKLRLVANLIYDTSDNNKGIKNLVEGEFSIDNSLSNKLYNTLNGIGNANVNTSLRRLPFINYTLGGNDTNHSLSFDPKNLGSIPTFSTTDNVVEVEQDVNDNGSEVVVLFGHVGPINLNANVNFKIENGQYSILDNSPTLEGLYCSYSVNRNVEVFVSSNDDAPKPIRTFSELKTFVTTSNTNAENNALKDVSLILLNDLVLTSEDLKDIGETSFIANFASLDGNNKKIIVKQDAFNILVDNLFLSQGEEATTNLNVGLFTEISENTIIKNLTVVMDGVNDRTPWGFKKPINSSNANVNLSLNFGLLAGVNKGIITNCKVISTNDANKNIEIYPFPFVSNLTESNVSAVVGGLVGVNNGYITNSAVEVSLTVGGTFTLEGNDLNRYVSNGDFVVGGFAGENNGKISSSRFKDSSIANNATGKENILTAGFVANNTGSVMYSYAEGGVNSLLNNMRGRNTITSRAIVAGFVYNNFGFISDCYSNLTLRGTGGVAGFVQQNGTSEVTEETSEVATIENSISFSDIVNYSQLGSRAFVGTTVNPAGSAETSNNFGTVYNCYFLELRTTGGLLVTDIVPSISENDMRDVNKLTGFAFAVDINDENSAIWKMDSNKKPTLVAANLQTKSSRKLKFTSNAGTENEYNHYYYEADCKPGTDINPWLVYNAQAFNKIADIGNNEDSYRIIKDIEFDSNEYRVKTTNVTFRGRLDGNGLNLTNVYINLEDKKDSIGIFAEVEGKFINDQKYLKKAEVKSLNVEVKQLYASQVSSVGVISGIVNNGNVYNINVISNGNAVVHGKNIVGGVVGLVIGESQVFNVKTNIDVLSTYAGSNANLKEIGYSGASSTLLNLIKTETGDIDTTSLTISEQISTNSFAGGVVGVYAGKSINDFMPMLSELHSENTRIEGGVAGGVVGAISNNCMVTDLKWTTDIEKGCVIGRIAAGGVVGENRGKIMFARSEHTSEVQAVIDDVNNLANVFDQSLYNEQIFGTQKVHAVGGLVGLNIGGNILQSYSRLLLNNYRAEVAGGIIGVINGGNVSTVYSTGSVVASQSVGGIVGEMYGNNNVILSNVAAINAYSSQHKNQIISTGKFGSLVGFINKNAGQLNLTTVGLTDNQTPKNYVLARFFDIENKTVDEKVINVFVKDQEYINAIDTSSVAEITTFEEGDVNLSNTLLDFGEQSKRNILFSSFYYNVNQVWQSYNNSISTKTTYPKIINFKNYQGTTFQIDNKQDLINFINGCNSGDSQYLFSTVLLTNSVKLDEKDITNSENYLINGTFKGTIKGLKNDGSNATLNLNGFSLFKNMENATLENVDLVVTSPIYSINNSWGGFSVQARGAWFINCKVTLTLNNNVDNTIGGFVGIANNTIRFTNCKAEVNGEITSANNNIGGFVGSADVIDVIGAEISTNINLTASNNLNFGGLVGGANGGEISNAIVQNTNLNASQVEGQCNIGLIGGYTASVTYNNCEVLNATKESEILAGGDGYVAGLAGLASNINNSFSKVTITNGNENTKIAGLSGYVGGSVNNSYFNGIINSQKSNVSALIYDSIGNVNKCFAMGYVSGKNASGLVYNSGNINHQPKIEFCYSTAQISASNVASGLISVNQGSISSSYFAGKNMTGNERHPITEFGQNISRDVYYCKNFGLADAVSVGAKSVGEMLEGCDLIATEQFYYKLNGRSFPLIKNVFESEQEANDIINPTSITSLSEIVSEEGFYIFNFDEQQQLDLTTNRCELSVFSGILVGDLNKTLKINSTIFNAISDATIFGLNIVGELEGGYASIANEATKSTIEKCSFNGTIVSENKTQMVGGFVEKANNCVFSYSYIGENAKLNGVVVGGFIGEANATTFKSCYFGGTIDGGETIYSNSLLSGLVAKGDNNCEIVNCYVSGNLLGKTLNKNNFTSNNSTSINNSYSIAYLEGIDYNVTIGNQGVTVDGTNWVWDLGEGESVFPMLNGVGGQKPGTRVNPIQIKNKNDLQNIENNSSKSYVLTSDIDFKNFKYYQGEKNRDEDKIDFENFEPIENFKGTLFGNGKTISNLLINNKFKNGAMNSTNRDENGVGLFATVIDKAYIFNLNIDSAEIYASNVVGGAGFVVGEVESGGKAYVIGVTVSDSKMYAGYVDGNNTSKFNFTFVGKGENQSIISNSFDVNNIIYGFNDSGTIQIPNEYELIPSIRAEIDKNGYYLIDSANKFIWWLNNFTGSGLKGKLMGDIDLGGYVFKDDIDNTKLASVLGNFSGELDGNFCTISNFYCYNFINENNGIVKNLNLLNVNAVASETGGNIGLIAAINNGLIKNCMASGAVTARSKTSSIAGQNNGTIKNCYGSAVVPDAITSIKFEYQE